MKKIAYYFLLIVVVLNLVCLNMSFVSAEDNETDLISLKNTVTLKLNYKTTYKCGYTPLIPESAIVNEFNEEISITEVDVLYQSIDKVGYNSEVFPTEIGTYKVTWTIKDDNDRYKGSGTSSFDVVSETLDEIDHRDVEANNWKTIEDVPLGLWVSNIEDKVYTGSKITISNDELRVYYHTKLLILNSDYTVKYLNNTKVGDATIVITGKGNYKDSINKTFKINALKVVLNNISDSYLVYNKKGVSVSAPKVTFNNSTLKNNVDYTYTIDGEQPKKLLEAKDYTVTISPISSSNYTFDPITYTIHVQDPTNNNKISSAKLIDFKSSLDYTGSQLTQDNLKLTYKIGKDTIELKEGIDYLVTYLNNKDIGTASMIIVGKGDYYGSITKTFKIVGKQLSKVTFLYNNQNYKTASLSYTGKSLLLDLVLRDSLGNDLVLNRDYTAIYTNNVNVGTATITYTGINSYTGSVKKTFKIIAADIKGTNVTLDNSYTYLKGGVKPEVVINDDDKTLLLNKDYTLSYSNNNIVNDNSGKKKTTITIKGKGNYSGSIIKEFNIVSSDISKLDITIQDKQVSVKANQYNSVPTITDKDGKVLKAGTDYDKNIEYKYNNDTIVINSKTKMKEFRTKNDSVLSTDIIPSNTIIKVTIKGINSYAGKIEKTFRIYKNSISKIKFKINPQVYTGEPIYLDKQDIIITSKETIDTNCYEIVSYSNNVNKGTASVTIKGIGLYGGLTTIKFDIVAKSVND